ncbi:MAG: hypothetical protein ABIO05_02200, partial [Ferruginibacter sp.]
ESTQKKNYSYHKNFYGAMRLFVNKHEQGVIKLFSQVGILLGHNLARVRNRLFFTKKDVLREDAIKKITVFGKECSDQFKNILPDAQWHLVDPVGILAGTAGAINYQLLSESLQGTTHVLFVFPDITYKQAMQIIDYFKNKFTYLFHGDGSGSFVSSNNKNNKGFAVQLL